MYKEISTYTEITVVVPWFGEFMVHLDEHDYPVRIYTYVDQLKPWREDVKYLRNGVERDILTLRNYVKGQNPVFVHLKPGFVKAAFALMVRRGWYEKETDESSEGSEGQKARKKRKECAVTDANMGAGQGSG